MRTGGEPMRHRYRRTRERPRRVVLLCDVSGSMASYSRALLRFMHASVASGEPVEAFVMGTRLTRVTRELSTRNPDRALREAGDILLAIGAGALRAADLVVLADIVRGSARPDPGRPRLFKSTGMSWEDAVVAAAVVDS